MNNTVVNLKVNEYALELYPYDEINKVNPLPNQFVYVINVIDNKVVFCFKNVENIIDYKPIELKQIKPIKWFIKNPAAQT